MITHLDPVVLKTGEIVEAAVVQAPEPAWASSIAGLLAHKGDPWNWQNSAVLERELGIDAFFYVLHRKSKPFANIMTVERDGIGIFGHVWTEPSERQKGASSLLMGLQMADFRQRHGRALYLNTGNPIARGLYERFGFRRIEADSSLMSYTNKDIEAWEEDYFAGGGKIVPLAWRHWPAACPLLVGDGPGTVRIASIGILGRATPEEGFLPLLRNREADPNGTPNMMIYELSTGAVAGLAAWGFHPIWPSTLIVDLYCHEKYWPHGGEILHELELPPSRQLIAYSDPTVPAKNKILLDAGFSQMACYPNWLVAHNDSKSTADLLAFRR